MTGLVKHIPSSALHVSKPTWWLESRFHFSFADYYSPSNTNFGALRVLNDDLVKGKAGFGKHPHRDAEIFTYVIDGDLTHKDSLGNSESLGRGAVQYMSAGTGVVHSELNESAKTCRFVQTWVTPDRRGLTPQYGSAQFAPAERRDRLLHILGGSGPAPAWAAPSGGGIRLYQDVNVVVCEAAPAAAQALELGPGRQAYLVALEGTLEVRAGSAGGVAPGSEHVAVRDDSGPTQAGAPQPPLARLETRDAAELVAPRGEALPLLLAPGVLGAHFMLVEMARP